MLNSKVPEMGDWLQEREPPWFRFSGNPPPRKVRDKIRLFGVGCFKMGSVLSSLVSWGTQRQLKPWGLWATPDGGKSEPESIPLHLAPFLSADCGNRPQQVLHSLEANCNCSVHPNPHSQLCHRCPQLLSLSRMARDFVQCPRWFSVKLRKCGGGW